MMTPTRSEVTKSEAARLLGSLGGKARKRKTTRAQRVEAARKAGLASGRARGKKRAKGA